MWFLSVFDVNHTHEYELNKYADEGASLTITVEYKGKTQVPAVPQPLSDDNKTGWFVSDVLEEAAVNSGRDETGYRLNGGEFDPDELFGEGGSLRRIKTFVISQRPAITLSFTNFDFSEIEEDFKQGTDVTFKLLGGSAESFSRAKKYTSHRPYPPKRAKSSPPIIWAAVNCTRCMSRIKMAGLFFRV